MKKLSLRDTEEFRRGREFEQGYARLRIMQGLMVVRQYDLNVGGVNKAPMIEGQFKGLRLPDLLVFQNGKGQWHECKEKTNSTYYAIGGREEHGIGLACYHDYLEVQRISGQTVCIVIGEWKSGTILIQSLNHLGPPRPYEGSNMPGGEWMAFWPRDQFDVLGRFTRDPNQVDLPLGLRPKRREIVYAPEKWRQRA